MSTDDSALHLRAKTLTDALRTQIAAFDDAYVETGDRVAEIKGMTFSPVVNAIGRAVRDYRPGAGTLRLELDRVFTQTTASAARVACNVSPAGVAITAAYGDVLNQLGALLDSAHDRGSSGFEVTESFQLGKNFDPDLCEDRFRDGHDFTVVVDGSTDKTGLRFNGRTGGWAVAELIADVVADATTGTSGVELVEAINAEYARRLGADLAGAPDHQRPSAVFVALDKPARRVIAVGDAQWGTNASPPRDLVQRGADHAAAQARAALLGSLIASGATMDELRVTDPGRAMVMPLLLARAHARNNLDVPRSLCHASIDGHPVPADLIEETDLTGHVITVVLATDGYPSVRLTLAETEAYLAESLAFDPLRIGVHAGTKAHHPDQRSYDDRTFVRLDLTPKG